MTVPSTTKVTTLISAILSLLRGFCLGGKGGEDSRDVAFDGWSYDGDDTDGDKAVGAYGGGGGIADGWSYDGGDTYDGKALGAYGE